MKKYVKFFLFVLLITATFFTSYTWTQSAQQSEIERENQQLYPEGRAMQFNELTEEEEAVILHRGTEYAFTGEYNDNKDEGLYVCRRCDAPLYHSIDKFDSRCGWPSFDLEIPGSVLRIPDPDGMRTEIVCSNCGGHLGHVFLGEGFTENNTRHCVNSISMRFLEETSAPSYAFFGGGCFWGVEDGFSHLPGVLDVVSGYMGGHTSFPTYNDVITGETGHAEVVRITYDPSQTDFETLARYFFEIHDPTQLNRQGVDVGSQYRSVIFYTDEAQEATSIELKNLLIENGYDVVTEILPAPAFFAAEDYHQDFTARTGRGACHLPVRRFDNPA